MSLITPDRAGIFGNGFADVWSDEGYKAHLAGDPQARSGDLQSVYFTNLITNVGDEYYAERAANIATPPAQVTAMQLGTGTTAVAKNGAGAGLVTLVTTNDTQIAIDGGFPTSTNTQTGAVAITIAWKVTWAAGIGTVSGIAEVVLNNQSSATQTIVPVANTISRALLSPVVNKGASDTLAITWNHNILGA